VLLSIVNHEPKKIRAEFQNFPIKNIQNFFDMDVVMCISTHRPNDIYSPETSSLLDLAKKISCEAKNGALISIESTIPKGTSKKMFEIMNHRVHVVHVPHRWYALEEEIHGVNQLRVIGGVSKCCLSLGLEFYGVREIKNYILQDDWKSNGRTRYGKENREVKSSKSLSIPLHPVSKVETAEVTKIVENSYRYVQIAFAEELYMYCKENGVSFSELRNALNTKWNVNILEPRDGIGGHCLPKDTKMFLESSKVTRSKIVIEADDDYHRYKEKQNVVLQTDLSI
jgi:UDP-N-acetyl-D-mannosaminuronic acid dehydrogenase